MSRLIFNMGGVEGENNRRRRGQLQSWSDLSPELLTTIGEFLETRLDIFRFRSVCRSWRSSLPLPKNPNLLNPILPLKIPKPYETSLTTSLSFNHQRHEILHLVATKVFLVQPLDLIQPNNYNFCNCWILWVEEKQPGKLRLLYPLSRQCAPTCSSLCFPTSLNLSGFRVVEIGSGYRIRVTSLSRNIYRSTVIGSKVVVAQNSPNVADSTAIVLCPDGSLVGIRLTDGKWERVGENGLHFPAFRDVICFQGRVYAVLGGGRLYAIDHTTLEIADNIVDQSICDQYCCVNLVESCEGLLLVVSDNAKVYKLDEARRRWDEVKTLGDVMMFVGPDCCFLVSSRGLLPHEGSFVVSANKASSRRYKISQLKLHIRNRGIYLHRLETGVNNNLQLESACQVIANMLWTPPIWLWLEPPTFPSSRVFEEEDVAQSQYISSGHKEKSSSSLPLESQEQNLDISPSNPPFGSAPEKQIQGFKSGASTMRFEGVDIKSELVPVLQKVWAKHGNIAEGSNVHSKDMLASALESMAKVIIMLQSNTGRTLTKSQCDDMSSIMLDLKYLRLRVEWLVPYVEKAVNLFRRKLLINGVSNLDKVIPRTRETTLKFGVDEFADLHEKIASVGGPIDLDQYIGEGMF